MTDTSTRPLDPFSFKQRAEIIAAEQCVIGAIVQSRRALDEVSLILQDHDDFYRPVHGLIYKAVMEHRAAGGLIEPLPILAGMDSRDVELIGGGPYLQTCMASLPTIANAAYYARLVRKAAKLRKLYQHGIRSIQVAEEFALENADDAVALVQDDASKLTGGGGIASARPWGEVTDDLYEEIKRLEAQSLSGEITGICTGWEDFDRLTNNLQAGQMVVFAGRPGMGKTVAGANIVQNATMRQGKRGLIFTAEMSAVEMGMRMICAGARIPLHAIKSGVMNDNDWARLASYIGETADAKLFVDDTPNVSWAHIEGEMHKLEAQGELPDVVMVDYLGLMVPPDPRKPRREQIDDLTRMGKMFAKRWNVLLIMIAQLNRGNEQRSDKRPQLSDLRESGSIEADADIVVLLHRDDYYDKETPRAGEVDLIVAKHRGGPTDTITLASQLHLSRFVSMAIT